MQSTLRAAVIQLSAGLDKLANLAQAERFIRAAAKDGAQLVVLPELFNAYGPLADVVPLAEPIPGPTSLRMAALAAELRITLCAGSICEAAPGGRGYNTSLLLGPDGALLASYRKRHLFNVDLPGEVRIVESDSMLPGDAITATATPLATFGQAICYDLRFPEHFRRLAAQAMEVLLLPSAFTAVTGRAHWEVLVRARAIENQCYVLAANQHGARGAGPASFGTSLIVDPWGEVMARAAHDEDAVLIADLSAQRLAHVRAHLPALAHRRDGEDYAR